MSCISTKLGMIVLWAVAIGLTLPAFAQSTIPQPPKQVLGDSQLHPSPATNSTLVHQSNNSPRPTPANLNQNAPIPASAPRAQSPTANRNVPPLQRTSPSTDRFVQDIQGIRQSLGGGVSESLNGLISGNSELEDSARQEFENELNRLAFERLQQKQKERENEYHQLLQQHQVNNHDRTGELVPNELWQNSTEFFRKLKPDHSNGNSGPQLPNRIQNPNQQTGQGAQPRFYDPRFAPQVNPANYNAPAIRITRTKAKASPTQQLREAAVKLEQMAAQFEESELYEEADDVREQAKNLWLKARDSGNPSDDVGDTIER